MRVKQPFYPCRGHLGFFKVDYPYTEGETFWRGYAYGMATELLRKHKEKMAAFMATEEGFVDLEETYDRR